MEAATKLEAIQWMEARKAGTMLSPEEGLAANALNDVLPTSAKNKGGPENPKAKRQQTNLSNTDNWFISFSPLASFFLEDEHYWPEVKEVKK